MATKAEKEAAAVTYSNEHEKAVHLVKSNFESALESRFGVTRSRRDNERYAMFKAEASIEVRRRPGPRSAPGSALVVSPRGALYVQK